jgi:hypothetical protein
MTINNNHSDHDHNDESKTLDARNLTLPIITMISIIGFVIWATYMGTTVMLENRAELVDVKQALTEIKSEVQKLKIKEDGPNREVTATDMAIFCLRAQIMNKEWRCPSVNHTYNSLNNLNNQDLILEIERLNRSRGGNSPMDKNFDPLKPQSQ